MAKVSAFFTTLRYDLRDFSGQDYDDTQLLIYFNRALRILDTELMKLRSDRTMTSDSVTLLTDDYSVDVPTNCSTVRYIYINQVLKRELSIDSITRMRILDTSTGEPSYWSQHNDTIEWDKTADDDYTCVVMYDKWSGTLGLTDDMPYNDDFNNYLVQGTCIMANAAKKDEIVPTDQQVHSLFRSVLSRDVIVRNFKKRTYVMDF